MPRLALLAFLLAAPAFARADAPADAPSAAPDATPTTAPEPTSPEIPTAPTAAASAPRVVVVVRGGDPAEDVVAAATELEAQLAAAGLVLPGDEGMRTVLRGGVPASPEGYEPARAARLRLGWSAEQDREALTGIGRFVSADAIVVVTGTEATINVEVFDAAAGDFYEGAASIAASDPSPAVAFVRARARAALRRRIDPGSVARAQAPAAPASRATTAADDDDDAPEEEPRWIKRNWPILLAGALLAGTVTYFVVSRRRDVDTDPPVIRIRPGGN